MGAILATYSGRSGSRLNRTSLGTMRSIGATSGTMVTRFIMTRASAFTRRQSKPSSGTVKPSSSRVMTMGTLAETTAGRTMGDG